MDFDTPTNPFSYGSLALDDSFADRESEVAELTSDIRNGQDVVVFAPRRCGKSSLIWRVARVMAAERVLVAQVDLMTTPTKEGLAAALAKSIYEQIASPLERAREKALAPFRGLQLQWCLAPQLIWFWLCCWTFAAREAGSEPLSVCPKGGPSFVDV